MPLKSIYFIIACFFLTAQLCIASETTLRFEIPEYSLDTNKVYYKDDLYTSYEGWNQRGIPTTEWRFSPLVKDWEQKYTDGTDVNNFFIEEFVAKQQQATDELKAALSQENDITYVHYVNIIQKPMKAVLGVRGNKVIFEMSGLQVGVKVGIRTSGASKLFCGSSATGTFHINVNASGEYDLSSGLVYINKIDLNQSSNVDCSSLFGKIFDFAFDYLAEKEIKDQVDKLINPILASSLYVGPFENLFSEKARQAGQILGFDIVNEAWGALSNYVDGLSLEFNVGIDYYGAGKHLLGFAAYQEPVEFNITSKGDSWRRIYTANFTCPNWANNMNLYEATLVQTGTRMNGRTRVPVYDGRKFTKVNVSGLNYSKDIRCSGRLCGNFTSSTANLIASCESDSGLSSYQSASGAF